MNIMMLGEQFQQVKSQIASSERYIEAHRVRIARLDDKGKDSRSVRSSLSHCLEALVMYKSLQSDLARQLGQNDE